MAKRIIFFDTEIGVSDKKIRDIGAISRDKGDLRTGNITDFCTFVRDADFLCGQNIFDHDMKYLAPLINGRIPKKLMGNIIDTLYWSPLMFPKKPYHRLGKEDKYRSEELNNPVNDSRKAMELFFDEINAFRQLSDNRKKILHGLLYGYTEFRSFFDYLDYNPISYDLQRLILTEYGGRICASAKLEPLIKYYPRELAYALALIGTGDRFSIMPQWLLYTFPKTENTVKYLCSAPCESGCDYCRNAFDIHKKLPQFFGEKYTSFREFDGVPLQERAVRAAVEGKSMIVVFPTGGGKSLTFQLPALMANEQTHGLTVVISPLQSLMKDQVDNLAAKGIDCAVTINGSMSPIERKEAVEAVSGGSAALLYISPEQLRSKNIKAMLKRRSISRFVIDEAHCFSAWGQDFRVEYLYIADAIKELQNEKLHNEKAKKQPIPVSCFTATAKQNVITDIKNYFQKELGLELEEFSTRASRKNLTYTVLKKSSEEEKYEELRRLINKYNCPTIVYATKTHKTEVLAKKLNDDGYSARAYHGKMDPHVKIENQDAFMCDRVQIIVATSAFGMGVDKPDVGLVVHYQISDSLENYVQEAGRAGRDPNLQAHCYVLYNENDLDSHFIMLNQSKLSMNQIQQVWRAIKNLTPHRMEFCRSALEIAREAGWNDQLGTEIETRVKTSLHALQNAGYIERGDNMPKVFATSIKAKSMIDASGKIESSTLFSDTQKETARRIMTALVSKRSIATAGNDEAESRIDYLADNLGLTKETVIESVDLMKRIGLLENFDDMSAYIDVSDSENRSSRTLEQYAKLERFLIEKYCDNKCELSLKEINEAAIDAGIKKSSVKAIRIILSYLAGRGLIDKKEKKERGDIIELAPIASLTQSKILDRYETRLDICRFILKELYSKVDRTEADGKSTVGVDFSVVGLFNEYLATPRLHHPSSHSAVEDALLYLSRIGALKLEGGFLVLYNGLKIKRKKDSKSRYKVDEYKMLDNFYQQKVRQIHIVGEYADLMDKDVVAAMQFVDDYFTMEFKRFLAKYFKGERSKEIERNITRQKYEKLFGDLSDKQEEIISDSTSKNIVVAAGPGSGKTKVLVHKLASLYQLEDVKHEQMLMLTFSRAAVTEFKKRLRNLIGNAEKYIEIKTFHSYCFDLLGRPGNIERSGHVVKDAVEMISNGEVERGKLVKTVLVIDEAQDMDENEYNLVRALMQINDDMRVIAVGDDDQNIYEFRGSDSKYLRNLIDEEGATKYEMVDNYRSCANVIALANEFAKSIKCRMKDTPVRPWEDRMGTVRITHHSTPNMEEAVVREVIETHKDGTACVLTNTNDEALRVLGLLIKNGKRAKLVQSLSGDFRLYDILEIRAFLTEVDRRLLSPVISDDDWSAALKVLDRYSNSTCIDNVRSLLADFAITHSKKYRSDLQEFLNESRFEDFYDDKDSGVIYVSTVHKSKGKEFDSIYLMPKNSVGSTDAERRVLYVGMTRAKNNLYIHTNTALFNSYRINGVEHLTDGTAYCEPKEITVQMTHRDVVLDYFKGRRELIFDLRSGARLSIDDVYLIAEIKGSAVRIAKFSKSFTEKIETLKSKGFTPTTASVRFIVAWKGEEDVRETPIVLADIEFVKQD